MSRSEPLGATVGRAYMAGRFTTSVSPTRSVTLRALSAAVTVTVTPVPLDGAGRTVTCTSHSATGRAQGGVACRHGSSVCVLTSAVPGVAARYSAETGCPLGNPPVLDTGARAVPVAAGGR